MLKLNALKKIIKKKNRVGRGGSRGGTSGRGWKGQLSRSGGKKEIRHFFEGGQMPISRRLPRRGFTNVFKKECALINLHQLENNFDSGDHVDIVTLRKKGLIKGKDDRLIKLLGSGTLTKKLIIVVDAFSKSAQQAVEKVNGTVQLTREASGDSISA